MSHIHFKACDSHTPNHPTIDLSKLDIHFPLLIEKKAIMLGMKAGAPGTSCGSFELGIVASLE